MQCLGSSKASCNHHLKVAARIMLSSFSCESGKLIEDSIYFRLVSISHLNANIRFLRFIISTQFSKASNIHSTCFCIIHNFTAASRVCLNDWNMDFETKATRCFKNIFNFKNIFIFQKTNTKHFKKLIQKIQFQKTNTVSKIFSSSVLIFKQTQSYMGFKSNGC